MVTLGEGGVGGCPLGTHSITFIHFKRRWNNVPWQLIVLPVCLIGLPSLVMWSICEYFLNHQFVVCLLARFYYTC